MIFSKRGFTRAIATDQTHPLVGLDGEIRLGLQDGSGRQSGWINRRSGQGSWTLSG
jgi:hypothetical protein